MSRSEPLFVWRGRVENWGETVQLSRVAHPDGKIDWRFNVGDGLSNVVSQAFVEPGEGHDVVTQPLRYHQNHWCIWRLVPKDDPNGNPTHWAELQFNEQMIEDLPSAVYSPRSEGERVSDP